MRCCPADRPDGDMSTQGFRAWVPPSRKRPLPPPTPEAPNAANGEFSEGLPGDHSQMLQGNNMSVMHRPGGSALHSRTKQQCMRSGQNQASHGPPAWESSAAFPSYTQLARQQVNACHLCAHHCESWIGECLGRMWCMHMHTRTRIYRKDLR